ncbi:hypothetical protein JSE7799_02411 [Jannaschia seosinensis]|uniref:DUF177 domain-containing protein n=1 Tax=Jannaschia seosinensis TaxID=313367 RepID=A0A0M7BCP8_9RHOB|nr:YceD family protein [Jannaschia seosinensis]CUH39683.1 hypothetical protein JSE7799_02411 [Jannaschia seosinensis]
MRPVLSHPIRLADLPQRKPTEARLTPDEAQLATLAERLGVSSLRKVALTVTLTPGPGRDWTLDGTLGATIRQPCRVTTDPVTTRVDVAVARRYSPDFTPPGGEEDEMPEDDTLEPLPATLDLGALLEEELALAVPPFPRADGAEALDVTAAPPGAEPLTEEKVKPFAGLADLKARMEGGTDDDAEQ